MFLVHEKKTHSQESNIFTVGFDKPAQKRVLIENIQ